MSEEEIMEICKRTLTRFGDVVKIEGNIVTFEKGCKWQISQTNEIIHFIEYLD